MQYMLMFYQPESEFLQREEIAAQAYRASWMDYVGAIRQSGIALNGHGLHRWFGTEPGSRKRTLTHAYVCVKRFVWANHHWRTQTR